MEVPVVQTGTTIVDSGLAKDMPPNTDVDLDGQLMKRCCRRNVKIPSRRKPFHAPQPSYHRRKVMKPRRLKYASEAAIRRMKIEILLEESAYFSHSRLETIAEEDSNSENTSEKLVSFKMFKTDSPNNVDPKVEDVQNLLNKMDL